MPTKLITGPNRPDAAALEQLKAFLDGKAQWVEIYRNTKPTLLKKPLSTDKLVALIYQTLTSARFCRQRPVPETFLRPIRHAVAQGVAIPITIIHGPLKNRNNVGYQHPDWAEWFAGIQLHRLGAAVKTLYEPGLTITYLLDDARSEHANHVPPQLTDTYRQALQQFLVDNGFCHLIQKVISLRPIYESTDWSHHYSAAKSDVDCWWQSADFATRREQYKLHAERNSYDLDDLTTDEREEWIAAAAYRYCVAFRAEQQAGVWQSDTALTMLYSPYEGYHQLFTLRRGSVSQPWQGTGAVTWTGQRWDPTLITRQPNTTIKPYPVAGFSFSSELLTVFS